MNILVVLEDNNGAIHRMSLEAIVAAQKISSKLKSKITVLAIGRNADALALEASDIKTKTINTEYKVTCEYPDMNKVMRVIKEKNLNVTNQILELDCQIFISVRENEAENIFDKFEGIYGVKIEEVE